MKFRRKSATSEPVEETAEEAASEASAPQGPYDVDDVADDDGTERIDLGSLLITPSPNRELRLQVDEASQAVQAVLLAGPDGALELRAFSASRNGDLWSEVRPQLAADMARRGGTATEREGRFGPELACQLSVQSSDGAHHPAAVADRRRQRRRGGCCGPRSSAGRPPTRRRPSTGRRPSPGSSYAAASRRCLRATRCPLRLPDNARKQQPPTA